MIREEGARWTGRGISAVGFWSFQLPGIYTRFSVVPSAGEQTPAPRGGFTCPRSHSKNAIMVLLEMPPSPWLCARLTQHLWPL